MTEIYKRLWDVYWISPYPWQKYTGSHQISQDIYCILSINTSDSTGFHGIFTDFHCTQSINTLDLRRYPLRFIEINEEYTTD
jgi:hypothetical protein